MIPFCAVVGCGDGDALEPASGGSGDGSGDDAAAEAGDTTDAGDPTTGGDPDCRLPEYDDLAIVPAVSADDHVFNAVLQAHLDRLYEAIGRYAIGDTPVFRGSLLVRDNGSDIGDVDAVIDSDEIVASLTPYADVPGSDIESGRLLLVFDPISRQHSRFVQPDDGSGITQAGIVVVYWGGWGVIGSCSGCAAPWPADPESIDLDLVAFGRYTDIDMTEARIEASGQLTRVRPDALEFVDVLDLNSTIDGYLDVTPLFAEPIADGNDLVFELEDTFVEDVPEPGCERRVTYRAQWFVDAECLADYGLRDLEITSDAICCAGEGDDPAVECAG